MAAYKMVYMNVRGRGELLRLMFAYKGIEFEDIRATDVEEAKKGQLNCLLLSIIILLLLKAGRYIISTCL